ncbi:hypothetical protein [Roseateles violae]|uniref:Uncharacterized protein n=1 Tax=Roseateles violae TaxID=3058042 RepID=A0ABT8DNZ6_9BURK|nr:hypothetical protein [Pelomonas sp. PFR6]MDN3920079.1 hypothetical protein [Pelomonas sp. PFR6]
MANIDKGRRDLDWSAIELDYRAGILSLRELGAKHRCSHSTIANLAGRKGWLRSAEPGDHRSSGGLHLCETAGRGDRAISLELAS